MVSPRLASGAGVEMTPYLTREATALSGSMDPEKGPTDASKLLDGFPKVAAWSSVTGNIDKASDIFKTFHRSSTRNLLYLQSRVAALQEKQARFDQADYNYRLRASSTTALKSDTDLFNLVFDSSSGAFDAIWERLKLLESIEPHIKDYERSLPSPSTSVAQVDDIAKRESPSESEQQAHSGEVNGTATGALLHSDEGVLSQYTRCIDILSRLENNRNSSQKLPPLPQDLFWGPVSDRSPRIISGIPEDFILHKACCSQRCVCYDAYQEGFKEHDKVLNSKDSSHIMQMLQQRARVLEDYYSSQLQNWQPALDLIERLKVKRTCTSLAITLAARSWEDFVIFASAEKMWERRRTWDELGSGKPWPFDMSDVWIGRMRERWEVARDLRHALQEYYEALHLQAKIMELKRPSQRAVNDASHSFDNIFGNGTPQFLNSSQGLLNNSKDLVVLSSDTGSQQPALIRWLSDLLAKSEYFSERELSSPNRKHVSETKITATVTRVVLATFVSLLVIAVWALKLVGDEVIEGADAKTVEMWTNIQLGILSIFTIGFSILTLLLGASRFEAFTATAAYAAVLVIFIAPVPVNVYGP